VFRVGISAGDLRDTEEVLRMRSRIQTPKTNITTNLLTIVYKKTYIIVSIYSIPILVCQSNHASI